MLWKSLLLWLQVKTIFDTVMHYAWYGQSTPGPWNSSQRKRDTFFGFLLYKFDNEADRFFSVQFKGYGQIPHTLNVSDINHEKIAAIVICKKKVVVCEGDFVNKHLLMDADSTVVVVIYNLMILLENSVKFKNSSKPSQATFHHQNFGSKIKCVCQQRSEFLFALFASPAV